MLGPSDTHIVGRWWNMPTFVLEMRSTADWGDVRYREYTSSTKKAELFKAVPKIRFSDSGHHIIPVVKEHRGPRLPLNRMLADHVIDAITAMGKQPKSSAPYGEWCRDPDLCDGKGYCPRDPTCGD